MLMTNRIWFAIGLVTVVVGSVRADHRSGCDCIGRLTGKIMSDTKELTCEFRTVFRGSPLYGQLQAEARDLYAKAAHLQVHARAGACVSELRSDVESVAQTFRCLARTVRLAEMSYRRHGGIGHCNMTKINALLDCLCGTIDEVREEVVELEQWDRLHGRTGPDRHVDHRHDPRSDPRFDPRTGFGSGFEREPHNGFRMTPTQGFTMGNGSRSPGITFSNGRISLQFGR